MFAVLGFLVWLIGGLSIIAIVMVSVIVHEMAHAYAAYKLGDHTAQRMGRLSWNPRVHLDLVGSIIVPILCFLTGGFLFGWAKPVPVDFQNIPDRKRGTFIVAAAGPFANLVLAHIGIALLAVVALVSGDSFIAHFSLAGGGKDPLVSIIASFLMLVIQINVVLMVFNLLPIPPLDGSKILAASVPRRYWLRAEEIIHQPMIDTLIGWLPETWRNQFEHVIWQWPIKLRHAYDLVFLMLLILIFGGPLSALMQGVLALILKVWL